MADPLYQGMVPPTGITPVGPVAGTDVNKPGAVSAYKITDPNQVGYTDTEHQKIAWELNNPGQPFPTTPNGTGNTGTGSTDYNGMLNDRIAQSDQAYNDFSKTMTQFQNGTFPLTPMQQAQLDGVRKMYEQQVEAQKMANKQFEGGTTQIGINTGQSRYAPDLALGAIQQATSDGITKVSNLQSKMASDLATLQDAFLSKDYDIVKSAYDAYSQHQKEVTAAIQDTRDAAQKAMQDSRDFAYKQAQDAIAQDPQSFGNVLKTAALNETQRSNLAQEAISRANLAKGRYQIKDNPDGSQSIFDTMTGQVQGAPESKVVGGNIVGPSGSSVGNTGIPILDANTKRSSTGVPYIDGTTLTGKNAQAAQLAAAKAGIPYLGKDGSEVIANVDTAKTNMNLILNSLNDVSPSNGLTRLAVGPWNKLDQFFQGSDAIASFNAYRSAAIQSLRAMAGSRGLRINQAEITNALNNDIPTITDTVGTAKGKIAKVNAMLESQERGLFGPQYDVMRAGAAENPLKSFYSARPADAKVVESIKTAHPNLSDDEVMQVVNALGPNLYSTFGIDPNLR